MESTKTILITGGCGYIGSHTALDLLSKGYNVVSIDNLSRSKQFVPERIKTISGKDFINYRIDLRDLPKLRTVLHNHTVITRHRIGQMLLFILIIISIQLLIFCV